MCPGLTQVASGLAVAPHIWSYIRDVNVDSYWGCACSFCGHSYSYDAAETDTALARTFPLPSRVRRFVIQDRNRWDLTDELRDGLVSIMRLPTLRCIGFVHCSGVPASLVPHALTRYQQVSFADSDFDHTNTVFTTLPPISVDRSAAPLTRLAVASRPDAKHTIITDPTMIAHMEGSLQHIQHLTLGVRPPGSLNGASQIATMCADSLQHLVIKFDEYHDNPVDLPRIPKLRFLTLQAEVKKHRIPYSLMEVMATLPDRVPNVQVVTVMVDAQHEDELMPVRHHPITDNALKRLPRLREVNFDISGYVRPSRFDVTQKLPMAGEAGLLSFTFSTSGRDIHDRVHNPMRYFSN